MIHSNSLIIDEDRWNSMKFYYFELMKNLDFVLILRKETFLVHSFRFNELEEKQEYPIEKLQQFINNIDYYKEMGNLHGQLERNA